MINFNAFTFLIKIALIILLVGAIVDAIFHVKHSKKIKKELLIAKRKNLSYNQLLTHKNTLETNYSQRIYLWITFLLILSTIFFSSTSLKTQIDLANQNINLIKQTSSSNWANVEIRFNEEGFAVDAKRLTNPDIEKYPLDFVIINSGKINTGQISVSPLSDKIIYTRLEPNNDINISPQSGKEARITLIKQECNINPVRDECGSLIIPHENYNLTLNFKCRFCQSTQESFNVTIPLCIYHNEEERDYCFEKY